MVTRGYVSQEVRPVRRSQRSCRQISLRRAPSDVGTNRSITRCCARFQGVDGTASSSTEALPARPRAEKLFMPGCPLRLASPHVRARHHCCGERRWRAGRSVRLPGPASARTGPAAPRAPARANQSAGRRHGRQSRAFKSAAIFGLRRSGRFGPRDALSRVQQLPILGRASSPRLVALLARS